MICPLRNKELYENWEKYCVTTECSWWCAGEKECAIKVLALEAIKKGE